MMGPIYRVVPRLLLPLLLCLTLSTQAASAKTNFLLIIADDSTWSDYGFAGNEEVRTPHLDKLRTEGMYLDHLFSPATTCSPSRHALYTGLYSVRSGAYPNHTRVDEGTKSIFSYLKEAGYRVALQNKSHVSPPKSFPYEKIKGADDLTETRRFMKRKEDEPWFLAYGSSDPHSKWTRGPAYDPAKITIPPYLHDNAKTRELLAKYYGEISKLDEQVGNLMQLLAELDQENETFVMFVSEQGSSFPYGGKWSVYDNGIKVSSLVRWPGKVKSGSKSQALISYVDVVPTLLEAAGLTPGKVDTGCPDVNGHRGFDGKSFMKVLSGEVSSFRETVFSQHTTVGIIGYREAYPMRAVRDRRFKYIRNLAPENTYSIRGIHEVEPLLSWQEDAKENPALAKRVQWLFKRPGEELYDLEKDPYEMNNLANDSELGNVKERLAKALKAWMKQQGDEGIETEMKAHQRQGKKQQNRKAIRKAS